jgi:hypothetical protein
MNVETIALVTFYVGLISGSILGGCLMRGLQLLGAVGQPKLSSQSPPKV